MKYSLKNSSLTFTLVTMGVFLIAWPLSFYGFQKYENIDLSFLFNILFIVAVLVWNIEKNSVFRFISTPAFLSLLILLLFTFVSLVNQVPPYEVLIATKPLIIFTFLFYSLSKAGFPSIPSNLATQIMKITCVLMFLKYLASLVLSLNQRPFFFHENNFELVIPLALLFCLKQKSLVFSTILILIILMSGSKSGIASLILLPIILYTYRQNLILKFLIFISFILFSYFIYVNFFETLLSIDRVFFLTNLLKFYDTSLLNILFGNFQISPLQSGVCHSLSYMTEKVSFDGEQYICFSRVINFTSIRLLVDFGFVFGLLIFYFWFFALTKLFPFHNAVALFFIGLLNGLSVSGFGNIYFVIALLFILSANRKISGSVGG
ncbi:N-formylglutamate deformylase protein [Candidatus Micropelagos thuwalensis]|uniref:N-formylglutamate deformylase protein n=1 Tax=Candidatus Micropelagius thuwalensis TaxID=1397666 RepID=U2XPL5_9PROT|nr:hypothetical protein [Candidatus Micropelagos thuwalensis]ERL47087.1 N-formylglutamate deformylase protein [Candidatus Micropelagos thuwalensis]